MDFACFTKQTNPRSFGSRCVKGTEGSTFTVDSSVPSTHRALRDPGFVYLVKKCKIRLKSDSFGFKNATLDFLKETTLSEHTHSPSLNLAYLIAHNGYS